MAGELYLFTPISRNTAMPGYQSHDPRRPRKLLVHRRERDRLLARLKRQGMTLVPLSLYFNKRGIAKLDIGLARGKRQHDKRETAQAARLAAGKGAGHAGEGVSAGKLGVPVRIPYLSAIIPE